MSFTPKPTPRKSDLPVFVETTNTNFNLLVFELNQIERNIKVLLNKPQAVAITKGSFTATLTGVTVVTTVEASYTITGDIITLQIPTLTALSNSTSCTITGMPDLIKPTRKTFFFNSGISSGATASVRSEIGTDGIIILSNGLNAAASSWVNDTLTKGIESSIFSYLLK